MSAPAAVVSISGGVVLILAVLRDVFHELFHPAGTGTLSRLMQRWLWRGFRRAAVRRRSVLLLAGPTILVAVVATWGVLLALGWALVFWPSLPGEFRFASPLRPATQDGFVDALYFSIVVLSTLGFGDVTPVQPLLRLLAAVEATLGFGLLTAAVSWTLSIYPVLSRRRTLAYRIALLGAGEGREVRSVADLDPHVVAPLLIELAGALAQARVDLIQSGITYYFDDSEPALALSVALPPLERLASAAGATGRTDAVRAAAAGVHAVVAAYAETVRATYLRTAKRPLRELLAHYAADQFREPPRG